MKKIKIGIGIDIDNVIADSYPLFLAKFNEIFKTKIKYEEIFDFYYLEKHTGVKEPEVKKFIKKYICHEEFQMNIPPEKGAIETIKRWIGRGHGIHYITSRPKVVRRVTEDWLKKHGFFSKEATLDIFDSDSHYNKHRQEIIYYKKNQAKNRGVNLFIEDSKEIAESLQIPVFLFDRPWNKGKLTRNIKRVKNWAEIDVMLNSLKLIF